VSVIAIVAATAAQHLVVASIVVIFSKFRMFHPLENTQQLYPCCSSSVCLLWRKLSRTMWAFQLFILFSSIWI